MSSNRNGNRARTIWPPVVIVLVYVAIAVLWIVASDYAIALVAPNHDSHVLIGLGKGIAYVLVTGGLLYALVRRHGTLISDYLASLERTRTELDRTASALEGSHATLSHTREELEEARRRLANLMDNLPGFVYRCRRDKHWTMEVLSEGCEAITGYPPLALIGNRVIAYGDLIHTRDRPMIDREIDKALHDRDVFQITYRIVAADGTVRWVWEKGCGVFEDGEVVALEGYVTDITREREVEAQLQQASKMEAFGRLAGGIAHDFNNILGIVLGNLQLIELRAGDDEKIKKYCRVGITATQRGADLTAKMMAVARCQPTDPEVIDVAATLARTREMADRMVGDDVEVGLDIPDDVWPVRADAALLDAAFLNLISNARDAMPNGGEVVMSARNVEFDQPYAERHFQLPPGPYVQLSVSDSGDGMGADVLRHIFEPFFTTKEKGRGTGLGLSTVFGFARQSGGCVTAYSEEGQGSTFRLYLPRAESLGEKIEREAVNGGPVPHGTETVLLVEDDPALAATAEGLMKDLGYTVIVAHDGPEGLAMLEQSPEVDILFSDVVMPKGMDGMRLIEEARRLRPGLPAVLASGFPAGMHQPLAGVPFIPKPFRKIDLARVLRQALDREEETDRP